MLADGLHHAGGGARATEFHLSVEGRPEFNALGLARSTRLRRTVTVGCPRLRPASGRSAALGSRRRTRFGAS
jgi:hypothetical protein